MYKDRLNTFALNTALAAGVVGDVISLGPGQRDVGAGFPMKWFVQTNTAITGQATINLVMADDETLATNPVTVGTIVLDATPAGEILNGSVNPTQVRRLYLGIQAVGSGTGSITSGLDIDGPTWQPYPGKEL